MADFDQLKQDLADAEEAYHQQQIACENMLNPLVERVAELRGKLWDAMAAEYGITSGEKRLFSPALEAVLREPHRQFSEQDINAYRSGFIVESYHVRESDDFVATIGVPDAKYGVGGIPMNVIAACEKASNHPTATDKLGEQFR